MGNNGLIPFKPPTGASGSFPAPAAPGAQTLALGAMAPLATGDTGPLAEAVLGVVHQARKWASDRARMTPLTYPEYRTAARSADKVPRAYDLWRRNDEQPLWPPGPAHSPELMRFVERIFDPEIHTPDMPGFINYLGAVNDDLQAAVWEVLRNVSARALTESDRRAHTLIAAGSRAGKTELMKQLIHHYVGHPELGGLLVIDPHSDMARQVARWKEFAGAGKERLVYLDAQAAQGLVPALNPLVRGEAHDDELSDMAAQLAGALEFFGGDGEGQTPQMQRLAKFILRVLLAMPGSSLVDMALGLTNRQPRGPKTPPPAFATKGRAHTDPFVADFFRMDFDGPGYASTRDALKRRMTNALEHPVFRRIITAPDPLDLEGLLSAGKVVVVACGSTGEARTALGRFLYGARGGDRGAAHRQRAARVCALPRVCGRSHKPHGVTLCADPRTIRQAADLPHHGPAGRGRRRRRPHFPRHHGQHVFEVHGARRDRRHGSLSRLATQRPAPTERGTIHRH